MLLDMMAIIYIWVRINDCRIIHDGSNFSITEATGDVTIQAADDIFLQPQEDPLNICLIME